ncbi:MAG: 30S ribosomal protein S6 [Chloroflexi bacterium]|nr:30S ribosomal protein S6 [Chloroflexota bacterium]
MRYYELMMVVAPQVDEEQISATLDRVNHYVSERGGSVVRQERWGRLRRLAYPIKNHNEGNYVLTHLEMEPQYTNDLEASILLSEYVLRHLLVKIDAIPEVKEPPPETTAEVAAVVSPEAPAVVEEGAAQEASVAVAADELVAPIEDQVAVVEDEPVAPAEDQVTVVEDEPAAPVEDQVAVVEDEPAPTDEEQEPQEEKKEKGT